MTIAGLPGRSGPPAGDPLRHLRDSPMTGFQAGIVALTVVLNALDGFDILAAAFASPGITAEWGLPRDALGLVLAASLLGMAAGSLLLASVADIWGRRPCILLCLLLAGTATGLSGLAATPVQLAGWRFLTGVGIGGMLPSVYALSAEYSNARRKELAVGLTATGFALGGLIGGALASWLLTFLGWRAVFFTGGALTLLLAMPTAAFMPESLSFLIGRAGPGRLPRINRILARLGMAAVLAVPPAPGRAGRAPFLRVFRPELLPTTLALLVVFVCQTVVTYYFLGWIPQMVADLGFPPAQAAGVAVAANLGGLVGDVAFSLVAGRLGLRRLVGVLLVGDAVTMALFGFSPAALPELRLAAALGGFCIFAVNTGMFILLAESFPVSVRATGTGLVIGAGRVGATVAPALAGFLFVAGWTRLGVSLLFACLALLAAVVLGIWALAGRRAGAPGAGDALEVA